MARAWLTFVFAIERHKVLNGRKLIASSTISEHSKKIAPHCVRNDNFQDTSWQSRQFFIVRDHFDDQPRCLR